LPTLLGVSNTALLNVNNSTYALYERDVPYKIHIDFMNKQIKTIKKFPIENIMHFSAHSKSKNNNIETIDYDIFTNTVSYYELNKNLKITKRKKMPTKYLPIVHDFWSSQNKIIFIDSPLTIELDKIFVAPMPVKLDETKNTYINILDKNTMKMDQYNISESFYMFHFANCKESDTNIEIYTTFYDKIDFSELNVTGKYRKILINKDTKLVQIKKYPELEELNLEFPILYDDKTLFRSIKNGIPNGFVICKDMEVIKNIEFVNKFICGEPIIKKIDNSYYLITYYFNIYNNKDSKILIMNLDTYDYIDIPLQEEMKMGFHSIFIPKQ
jgi:carotenoid cleavage dioxygenase-like enzyme